MNYFAHAFDFLDEDPKPFFLAGLAVPDWMNVVDRKIKTRSAAARKFLEQSPPSDEAYLALGIVQHHADDLWFHESPVFNTLCLEFTVELRDLLAPDPGFRPSFLGHILVELLLDDFLIRRYPQKIDLYYELLDQLDPMKVEDTVSRIAGRPVEKMHWFVERFREIRFLYDYSSDEKLLRRLNQVMQRVKLLPLPDKLLGFFDSARERVSSHAEQIYFEPRSRFAPNTAS